MGQHWEEVQTVLSPHLYPPSLEECSPHLKNLFPALYFRVFSSKMPGGQCSPATDLGAASTPPSLSGCLPLQDVGSGASSRR